MRNNYLTFLIVIICIISLIFFSLNQSVLRKLKSSNYDIEYCKNNMYEIFGNFNSKYYHQLNNFTFKNNEKYIKSFIEYIDKKGKEKKELKIYINHLAPYLTLISFTIILIVEWILFLINEMCLKHKKCVNCLKKNCKGSFYFILISFVHISIIMCLKGIFWSKTIFNNYSHFTCSMLKFINEVNEGQMMRKDFKWIGINNINNLLLNLNTQIINLKNDIITFNENITNFNLKEYPKFQNNLTEIYNNIINSDSNFLNDIPLTGSYKNKFSSNSVNLIPSFMKNFGPYKQEETILYSIEKEMNNLKKILIYINNNIQLSFGNNIMEDILTTSQINLENLRNSMDVINNNYFIPLNSQFQNFFKYGKNIFIYFFVSLIMLNIIFLFLVICLMCDCFPQSNKLFKLFIHIIWNIFSFIMIMCFFIGGLLIIIGIIGKDLISVTYSIFNSENLNLTNPKILKLGNGKELIDICLNINGSLKDNFFGSNSNNIDNLLSVENSIIYISKILLNRDYPIEIEDFEKSINNYLNKFMDTSYYIYSKGKNLDEYNENDIINPNILLNEINELISLTSECSLNEKWTISNICLNYIELNPNNLTLNPASPTSNYFLNLYDINWWKINESDLYERYSDTCIPKNSFNYNFSQKKGSEEFYQMFKKLYKENQNYILNKILMNKNNILTIDNNVTLLYNNIKNNINCLMKNAFNIINPIRKIFTNFLGEGNINTMLNCDFMKSNLNILFNVLYYDLGKNSINFGIYLIIYSLLLMIIIIFNLLIIHIREIWYEKNTSFELKSGNHKNINFNHLEEIDSKNQLVKYKNLYNN